MDTGIHRPSDTGPAKVCTFLVAPKHLPKRKLSGVLLAIALAAVRAAEAYAHMAHEDDSDNAPRATLQIHRLGSYKGGGFNRSAAEIVSYDAQRQHLYVTNAQHAAIDVLDISAPQAPKAIRRLTLDAGDGSPTSVAVHGDVIAVAAPAAMATDAGRIVFFDPSGKRTAQVPVGALPDMVVFDPSGTRLLVANEGEPSNDYRIDPEGSVSIIDLSAGPTKATVKTADFRAFGTTRKLDPGVRIFGPGASVAEDLEPEFIAVCPESLKAYVTLQENNAIARIDLETAEVEAIFPLGTKDHSLKPNGLDASAKDQVRIFTWPVHGMYQPDAIVCTKLNGREYLLTANEGNARDYEGYSEDTQVERVRLDADTFGDLKRIKSPDRLGKLHISKAGADSDGDGDFDRLFAFGARSFSIRTTDAQLIFDSGAAIERTIASHLPTHFNSTNISNTSFDERSVHKGPEPEGLVVGNVGGVNYVFVGLKRIGGIIAFDLSDPTAPTFAAYVNSRDFSGSPEKGTAGDLGPEGILFIAADKAPGGKPLLVTCNEISGTTTIWELRPKPPAGLPTR